jgi:hypothetical protein
LQIMIAACWGALHAAQKGHGLRRRWVRADHRSGGEA